MADRFTLGKTDTVSVCEAQDITDVEEEGYTDYQARYNYLQKCANEAFLQKTDEPARWLYQVPDDVGVYSPWNEFWHTMTNCWVDINSDTDAEIVIAWDTIPIWDTFPTVTVTANGPKRADNINCDFTAAGGATLSIDYKRWLKNPSVGAGEVASQYARGRATFSNATYKWFYRQSTSADYTAQSRIKADCVSDNPYTQPRIYPAGFGSASDIHSQYAYGSNGSYIFRQDTLSDTWITSKSFFVDVGPATTPGSTDSYASKNATMDWLCYYRTGITPPTSYPSYVRTLSTCNFVMKITGTGYVNTYAYIDRDVSGATTSVTLEHSTTGAFAGEETTMTAVLTNTDQLLYATLGHASTSNSYIKVTLAGNGTTSPEIDRLAIQATTGTDVFLIDTDTVDEGTADSFTEQFKDLAEKKFINKEEMIDFMRAQREDALINGEMFLQGIDLYTFGSYFTSTAIVNATDFTYSAGDDWYYVTPAYSVAAYGETVGIAGLTVKVQFDTGVLDPDVSYASEVGTAIPIYKPASWPGTRHEEDDDYINAVIYQSDVNSGSGDETISWELFEADTDTEGWTSIATGTSVGTDTGTASLGGNRAVHKYYKLEYTSYTNFANDDEMTVDIEPYYAKKTYASSYLETITFNLPHDYLYVGLLIGTDNTYIDSYVTLEYWNGAAYVAMNPFEIVDVSAYATTKLRVTVAIGAQRKKPTIEGLQAINFKSFVAGRTV